jgi:hypothetical protein
MRRYVELLSEARTPLADFFSIRLRFSVVAEIADDGLTLRLRQRRELSFANKTVHFRQDLLPFRHRPEPRIWHPMASSIGRAVATSTTVREHPPIGSVQIWDSGKRPSTPYHPHQK